VQYRQSFYELNVLLLALSLKVPEQAYDYSYHPNHYFFFFFVRGVSAPSGWGSLSCLRVGCCYFVRSEISRTFLLCHDLSVSCVGFGLAETDITIAFKVLLDSFS
jgi:hypothetical protein